MQIVEFIAEVSSNHNRDINRMKEFVHASKEAGCSGVKFQLFKVNKLFSPEILLASEIHRDRKAWELDVENIPELANLAQSLGLSFSCTPFYIEAVNELKGYVDFYKIASYEILWNQLFEACGNSGKPVVFSTGMAKVGEVKNALNWLLKTKTRSITILHCNSAYPTPVEDSNLAGINVLKNIINSCENINNVDIKIGYSDHTVSPAVIYRAIHKYNANFIEFHIDLDGTGNEFESGHCWLPEEISKVIETVKLGFISDGSGLFEPSPSEIKDREWRSDPIDGLRPLKHIRKSFNG